jgi:hypothetical protein
MSWRNRQINHLHKYRLHVLGLDRLTMHIDQRVI